MKRKSYMDANKITAAWRMLEGIKANAEKLEKQGIGAQWIGEFETLG